MKVSSLVISSYFVLSVILISCTNDVPTEVIPISGNPNYSQLRTGNYWVYQLYQIDTTGVATPLNLYDSCYIEKDTIIDGKKYYKYVNPYSRYLFTTQTFLRDSLHYIVTHTGEKIFSSKENTNTLSSWYEIVYNADTLAHVTTQMELDDSLISVPLGTYKTLNYKQIYHMHPNYRGGGEFRQRNHRYAVDVGIVLETIPFYVSVPFYTERRLVKYKVK